MNSKLISDMLAFFKAMPDEMVAAAKAVPADKLADLRDSIDHAGVAPITDQWNKPMGEHSSITRAEIVTGPAERMSGDGLKPMLGHYSTPAPQGGMVMTYQQLEGCLADFGKSLTANFHAKLGKLVDVVSDISKGQEVINAAMKGAAEFTAPAADSFFGTALTKITKGKSSLRKADLTDDEDFESKKSHLTEAEKLLKSALKLIAKAEDEEKNDDDKMEKAISDAKALQGRVTKALADIVKAEDEKKEDKKEVEKSVPVVAPALEAPAVKSSEESEKEEKKDDTAKAEVPAPVDAPAVKAIQDQLVVVTETVKGMMDKLMGLSAGVATPPSMTGAIKKSNADLAAVIDAAMNSGTLTSQNDILSARVLLSRHNAMAAGNYNETSFAHDVATAPQAVRSLFQS